MLVKDFLVKEFTSGPKETKLLEVIQGWVKNKTNIYVVTDGEGKVIGVATLYDFLKKMLPFYLQIDDILADFAFDDLLTPAQIKNCLKLSVGEIMSERVVSVKPEANFLQAASTMFSFDFDYLPVVNDEGICQGIVTRVALEGAILELVKDYIN